MLSADLHIHSTVSDGSCTIPEIIALAKNRRLDCIAITDHDTCAHHRLIPKMDGLKILPAIEISAMDKKTHRKAHILGYRLQNTSLVEKMTSPILALRHINSLKQIEILDRHGYSIDVNKLHRADGKYIYKQHIMEYLVATRQAAEMFGYFYQSVFKHGGICDFDICYMDVFDAVKLICEAGGIAVLAHSGEQRNFDLIPALVDVGLRGLEYNHHSNNAVDKQIIMDAAARHGLFLTGGSDFHGKYAKGNLHVGDYLSEESGLHVLGII